MPSEGMPETADRGPVWAELRWWSVGYGIRVVAAVIGASVITGAIVGPGMLLGSQLRVFLEGGTLEIPASMYWQAAAIFSAIGVLVAGVISACAVLMGTRRTPSAIVGRMQSGPLVAGGMLSALGLVTSGAHALFSTVPATAVACGAFFAATFATRLTRPADLDRVAVTVTPRTSRP